MTTTNLTGQWTGTITYGPAYRLHAGKELYFDLELVQQGHEIAGTAIDTGGTGRSPDPANILGTFSNHKIDFLKQYESLHYYTGGETKIDRSRKGPYIKYSGIYNVQDNTFSGDWVIRSIHMIFGIFPKTFKATGTWTMARK